MSKLLPLLALLVFLTSPQLLGQMRRSAPIHDEKADAEEQDFFEQWRIESREYRTPLAGQYFYTEMAGESIHIEPRDRRNVMAVNVGSSVFVPKIGTHSFVPFAAFYFRQQWQDDWRRLRAVLTGVVNYVDFADGTWNQSGIEAIARWENFTVPLPTTEIVDGNEVESSEIYWGHLVGSAGIGWRAPIFPFHCDNDFTVQLCYELGYLYTKKTKKSGAEVILPPNTFIHELHLRVRLDAFDRNLLELPHSGMAFGLDCSIGRRDNWADHQFAEAVTFSRQDTRDYLRISGYFVTALDVPLLSERHKILVSCHVAWSPSKNSDRFSAFRLGGGPNPSESNDLSRHPFPGALFDQFLLERYFLTSLEYRFEALFFLYLHVRGTLGWGRVAGLKDDNRLAFTNQTVESFSVGISSGFLWDSMLYLEYAYDAGIVRPNDYGHGVMVSWSKEL